jgi:hypothetical protein
LLGICIIVLRGYKSRTCKDSTATTVNENSWMYKTGKGDMQENIMLKELFKLRLQKKAWEFGWPYLVLTANHNIVQKFGCPVF